jgi:hypothetical protein
MRDALKITVLLASMGVFAGSAAAASPVSGSISGPITAVKGKTFTVKTTLSPTGAAKVSVGSKTTISERVNGARADLKKGACIMATGTKSGSTVTATRITLTSSANGSCTGGFGGGNRPRGARPGSGGGNPPGGNGGFRRPGNFAFAFGQITAAKGSTLSVKGFNGTTTKVTVSSKTTISKTAAVGMSSVKTELCAFVFGTSSDKGVTVQAQNVSLTSPVRGNCTFGFRRP